MTTEDVKSLRIGQFLYHDTSERCEWTIKETELENYGLAPAIGFKFNDLSKI